MVNKYHNVISRANERNLTLTGMVNLLTPLFCDAECTVGAFLRDGAVTEYVIFKEIHNGVNHIHQYERKNDGLWEYGYHNFRPNVLDLGNLRLRN